MTRVLYVTYDGLTEPLAQSQVLEYLVRLAANHEISLVSFEKPALWRPEEVEPLRERLDRHGIRWTPLRYHKRPVLLATAWDVARGIVTALRIARGRRVEILHVRSYVPAAIGVAVKALTGAELLFDMRGFWIDERADIGQWSRSSWVYRAVKRLEGRFLRTSDTVVSLTERGVEVMREWPAAREASPTFRVIPTCADLERFRPLPAPAGEEGGLTLAMVGSVTGWYLLDPMMRFFASVLRLRPDARLLVLNRGAHNEVGAALAAAGVADNRVTLKAVDFAEVPTALAGVRAGVFFIRPSFSKQASSPTKMAELLGCGIACVSNSGVGDLEAVLRGERVGVVVDTFEDETLDAAAAELLELLEDPELSERCRSTALRLYSVEAGVGAYDTIYRELAS